jgi:23S rRNA pseudouridine2605 synthase/23S rRNA pseudouridine2604 synthase
LGSKVDPAVDRITLDGVEINWNNPPVYIALNKPEGFVTSCRHPGEKTVVDLVDIEQRIFPVGRLDKDSTGLLLMTNDGRIHHRLSHPSFDHEKEYEVIVAHPMSADALRELADGVSLMGKRTRPAVVRKRSATMFNITLREGRNRQIRRMVRKIGNRVVSLKRIRVDTIRLGGLPKGRWRYLKGSEIQRLQGLFND